MKKYDIKKGKNINLTDLNYLKDNEATIKSQNNNIKISTSVGFEPLFFCISVQHPYP